MDTKKEPKYIYDKNKSCDRNETTFGKMLDNIAGILILFIPICLILMIWTPTDYIAVLWKIMITDIVMLIALIIYWRFTYMEVERVNGELQYRDKYAKIIGTEEEND